MKNLNESQSRLVSGSTNPVTRRIARSATRLALLIILAKVAAVAVFTVFSFFHPVKAQGFGYPPPADMYRELLALTTPKFVQRAAAPSNKTFSQPSQRGDVHARYYSDNRGGDRRYRDVRPDGQPGFTGPDYSRPQTRSPDWSDDYSTPLWMQRR